MSRLIVLARRRLLRSVASGTAALAVPLMPSRRARAEATIEARTSAQQQARDLDHQQVLTELGIDGAVSKRSGAKPTATGIALRAEKLSFAFIGDTPYGYQEEHALVRVMNAMPVDDLAFTLHVGDIKARAESCDNALVERRLGMLDASRLPLIYTPGDNEWTDCRVPDAAWRDPTASGQLMPEDDVDPAESLAAWRSPLGPGGRLRWLREHVFAGDRSLGRQPLAVERQGRRADDALAEEPRLPENQRWRAGGIQFCTLHIIGSDNGLAEVPERGPRSPMAQAAFTDWTLRQQANARWLFETIALAERDDASALVIALHANLLFGRGADDGYARFRELIAQAANRFRRPILLLHGDTHLYRVGRPLAAQGLPHLLQIECFGSPFVSSWLRIDWDPARIDAPDGPFRVQSHNT